MLTSLVFLAATQPLVIAHRGASGYRPEHTIAAYELAIQQGADYIEPDLVSTKDGVLIARHENELSKTTDIEDRPEFAPRKTTKTIDGSKVTGWFSEDLTLKEIKTLRAEEQLATLRPDSAKFNGQFEIPTFDEVVTLAKAKGVGVYPETKHPTYFRAIGLPLEEPLVAVLTKHGWTKSTSPVFIQSFEVDNLRRLNRLIEVPLIQLAMVNEGPFDHVGKLTYREMLTNKGLLEIRTYADGIGVEKALIFPRVNGAIEKPTNLVRRAQSAGLKVHVWTFRNEPNFLPSNLKANPAEEYRRFYATGIDGVFTDFPDTAVKARAR